ncbi:MAG: AarF/ABC1/UbiB kinase family protein [Leptospiraceae bacterium]|nr:AarF/ABC1/UbiB kinase family protein [Leptospiraceae bacterium]
MSTDEKSASDATRPGPDKAANSTENSHRPVNPGDGPRSGLGRSTTLGSLVGGLGASLLGAFVRKPFQNEERRAGFLEQMWLREAERLVEKLGQLKGAAMKLGQMLSLHEHILPPEASRILSQLQKAAPPIPFTTVRKVLEEELGETLDQKVVRVEEEPFASASIGQVHRAELKDGRSIVFKVQYPGVDRAVRQDIKQLRWMAGPMVNFMTGGSATPIFDELEEVMVQELDYERELANLQKMQSILADDSARKVPAAVPELSSRRVLAMEFATGLSFEDALSPNIDQTLRDQWAQALGRTFAQGLFSHRFLHADPNAGNFAFGLDGTLTLFDFGCMKLVPMSISRGYGNVIRAVLSEQDEAIPEILVNIGIHRAGGKPIDVDLLRPHAELVRKIFGQDGFRFGEDRELYDAIFELGRQQWFDSLGIKFPREILFVHRTLGGYFGNFSKLKASGPWKSILMEALEEADAMDGISRPEPVALI